MNNKNTILPLSDSVCVEICRSALALMGKEIQSHDQQNFYQVFSTYKISLYSLSITIKEFNNQCIQVQKFCFKPFTTLQIQSAKALMN